MDLLIEYIEQLIVVALLLMVIILELCEDFGFEFVVVEGFGSEGLLVLTIHDLLLYIQYYCCAVAVGVSQFKHGY
jgi:hypothetical protein